MSKRSHDQDAASSGKPHRRRPSGAQGERRVAAILDAAEAVFGEAGFEAATTNAIAARAGVSIGSVYQYFPDKTALFDAAADRYRTELHALYEAQLGQVATDESWPALLDRLIDPLVALEVRHARFKAVLCGSGWAGSRRGLIDGDVEARVEAFLAQRLTRLPKSSIKAVTQTCVTSVGALIAGVDPSSPVEQQQALVSELKKMLSSYLSSRSADACA